MTAPRTALPPRPHHLSDVDRVALRGVLVDELAAQHAQVQELQATIDELTGQQDGDSLLERSIAERSRQLALEAVADIEAALQRVDGPDYGTCERCGGPIALERLQAIPFTRHCTTCPPTPQETPRWRS